MNEPCHTYAYKRWVELAHMSASRHTYECAIFFFFVCHVTQKPTIVVWSYYTWMYHVTHMNAPCHTYAYQMSEVSIKNWSLQNGDSQKLTVGNLLCGTEEVSCGHYLWSRTPLTNMNEKRGICEWAVSHVRIFWVKWKLSRTQGYHEHKVLHVRMPIMAGAGTRIRVALSSHIWTTTQVARTNAPCHTHKYWRCAGPVHVWHRSHLTHMNQSCQVNKCATSHKCVERTQYIHKVSKASTFMNGTCLIHMWDVTTSIVWRDSCKCVTWLM